MKVDETIMNGPRLDEPAEEEVTFIPAPEKPIIGVDQVRKAMDTLKKYKSGKANLEGTIVNNELWWRLRHWRTVDQNHKIDLKEPRPASGWLFNVIISKHADFMDSYPSADILPREKNDKQEAQSLSSIIPVVLEMNKFQSVYSDEVWYKLKNGTGVYGIFWDPSKLNGLGDIAIRSMDLLSLYWEPGITNIQNSRNLFSVELVDTEVLNESYPEYRGQFRDSDKDMIQKYVYDDNITTEGKSLVVDWYYKKRVGTKKVLHYCKFVGDIVLYASENDPDKRENGWYDHGKYPFVFDVLFKEEGLPYGFGFVDVCKNPQISIDIMNNAFEKNLQMNANPRYFMRGDGGINEEEFSDPNKMVIHVDGNLGEDSIQPVQGNALNGNYITLIQEKIDEMKETAGNRDASTGGTAAGVTAASAIAAMQESAGKTSRDMIKTSYRAYEEVVEFVIELIRQFYSLPRQFRILGEQGQDEYVTYTNQGIQPQSLGSEYGVDMGYRLPVFDIKVSAEKENRFTQLSQNELALQFYNGGFFNPEQSDQVLACLDMMDFQGKDQVVQRVSQNGGMYKTMVMMQQQMLQMAEMIDNLSGGQTDLSDQIASQILGEQPPEEGSSINANLKTKTGEHAIVANAREQAAQSTSPR